MPGENHSSSGGSTALKMRCPLCHEPSLHRRKREGWRRLVPGMQAIRCHYCFRHFHYFLGMLFVRK